MLSIKLCTNNEVDLTVDDMAFIKERVGKVWAPVFYGRISDLFEGKKTPKERDDEHPALDQSEV